MKLTNIADIYSGVNYQKKDFSYDSKAIALIQVKDIQNNSLLKNNIFRIEKKLIDSRLLLNPGDILFSAKGNRNFAYLYKEEVGEATASSTFFIIRINRIEILSEYLYWYLNSKTAQDFFRDNIHGTFIQSISKSNIGELEIPIPSLEVQRAIIKIDEGHRQEKNLMEQIRQKRITLINEIINRKINQ